MTPRICIFFVGCAIGACTSRGVDCELPEFRAYSAAFESSIGARFADEYFTVWRTPLNSCEERRQRAIFLEAFFDGYRAGMLIDGDPTTEVRLMRAGAQAGEEYRRANRNSAAATYASFGYTAVTVNGTWTTGFETSRFMPAEGYEGEEWWLDPLPELATKMTEDDLPKEGLAVRISGYVSGLGRHGHLGAYQRRVYVREMNVLGIAQQPVAADRREDAAPAER
jgi:hypothetical protein